EDPPDDSSPINEDPPDDSSPINEDPPDSEPEPTESDTESDMPEEFEKGEEEAPLLEGEKVNIELSEDPAE
ncbi:MAG: hypothetical protein ACPGTU_20255, partial [Myxococcota bacterium]